MTINFLNKEKQLAVRHVEQAALAERYVMDELEEIRGYLAASAFSQRLGMQALIAAATMGAAGLIAKGVQSAIGARLTSTALSESAAGSAVRGLAKFGSREAMTLGVEASALTDYAAAKIIMPAACNTLGRLAAGLLSDPVQRYAAGGKLEFKLDKGLALSLLGAQVGVPGQKLAPSAAALSYRLHPSLSKIFKVALQSGSIMSYQNLVISSTSLVKGWTELIKYSHLIHDNPVHGFFASFATRGTSVAKEARKTAMIAAKETAKYVSANEKQVVDEAKRAATKINYNQHVNFLARGSKAVHLLREASIKRYEISAQYHLWHGALRYYIGLERAVLSIEELEKRVFREHKQNERLRLKEQKRLEKKEQLRRANEELDRRNLEALKRKRAAKTRR